MTDLKQSSGKRNMQVEMRSFNHARKEDTNQPIDSSMDNQSIPVPEMDKEIDDYEY